MVTPIIGPSTPLASIFTSHFSQKGGCMIVDSTRRGKRFPDSMSKTIPIWTCVLNRAICIYREKMLDKDTFEREPGNSDQHNELPKLNSVDWDCYLHLPLWVSKLERAAIEGRLEEWTNQFFECGADIAPLAACLKKPLRPLWISQKTVIWLNEVPDHSSWDFTPVILLSASSSNGIIPHRTTSEFSWSYIPGAGDDEESWSRGLSPNLFWEHVYDLINSGPDVCNQKVADIVERDRVYHAYRGQNVPQIIVKPLKSSGNPSCVSHEETMVSFDITENEIGDKFALTHSAISWLGTTNLAVGTSQIAADMSHVNCILNCDSKSVSVCLPKVHVYLHLPMVSSKFDRFSILNNLPSAVNFAKLNLSKNKRLLVCCHNGEDISVCVSLAILASLFDEEGKYDDGKSFSELPITKLEMRRRLVYICTFATNARPSRGNLKQVFNFLSSGKCFPSRPCEGTVK